MTDSTGAQAKGVFRVDRGELQKPEQMANGWLRVDGYLGRAGLLEYRRADGSVWIEYRPPEEQAHADVLNSFSMVPFTDNHPPGGYLDAENTKQYQVGTVETPRVDGERMRARILVTDAKTIAAMKAGKSEISCGYMADLDLTPGYHEGQHYDAVQRNIRGNHVALVSAGRAGPEIRVRVDAAEPVGHAGDRRLGSDAIWSQQGLPEHPSPKHQENPPVIKIKIDGVEFEVSEQVAQAIAKMRADHDAAEGAHKAICAAQDAATEKANARADAADAELKKAKAELADAPKKIREQVAARAALETSVRKLAGDEFKCDDLSDVELKRAAVESATGMKLDDKTEAYVDAAFDLALAREDAEPGLLNPLGGKVAPLSHVDSGDPVEAARRKFYEASRNASQTKQ